MAPEHPLVFVLLTNIPRQWILGSIDWEALCVGIWCHPLTTLPWGTTKGGLGGIPLGWGAPRGASGPCEPTMGLPCVAPTMQEGPGDTGLWWCEAVHRVALGTPGAAQSMPGDHVGKVPGVADGGQAGVFVFGLWALALRS